MFTKYVLTTASLALLGLGSGRAEDARDSKDREKLDGTWKLTRVEQDGKENPRAVGSRVEIRDGRIMAFDSENKQNFAISFKTDPGRKPHEIDMKIVEGKDKGKTAEGIYALEGDTLKICYSHDKGKRPREFKTSGEQQISLELKREKK
jgi:uncharacterized protein (TIGR03067 family)